MELLVVAWLAVGLVLVGRFVEKRLARHEAAHAPATPVVLTSTAQDDAVRSAPPTDAGIVRGLALVAQALNEERAIASACDVLRRCAVGSDVAWYAHDRSRDTWSVGRSVASDAAEVDRAHDVALRLALRVRSTITPSTSDEARGALRDANAIAVVPVFDRALTVGALVVHGEPSAPDDVAAGFDAVGAVLGIAIANARLSRQHLERQTKDPLTGLVSVETLVQSVARSLARGRVSIVLVAMPQMRSINLRYGRQAGDRALAAVARLVVLEAGESAEVGRFGGATLLVVLPGVAAQDARRVVDRIADRVGDTLRAGPQRSDEPLCLQAVVVDAEGGDAEALLREAEAQLMRDRSSAPRNQEA
ncbi:MAG: diguanylate cyclase [Planctomycetes bacterium]|nr:diguanylate cyclase [Planctomycetota bacterium]